MASHSKLNCWEYQGCGREPGGRRAEDPAPCPAAVSVKLDGVHNGVNAGRACWLIDDTMCSGRPTGAYDIKIHECRKCSFRRRVKIEEGLGFESDDTLLDRFCEHAGE